MTDPDLTAEQLAELTGVAELLRTQDNAITSDPIFVVQQRRRQFGMDMEYCEHFAWVDEEDAICDDTLDPDERAKLELLEKVHNGEIDWPSELAWTRTGYLDRWEFVQPFLTRQAAEDFRLAQAHNMVSDETRVFVESAYRNPEWKLLRAALPALLRMAERYAKSEAEREDHDHDHRLGDLTRELDKSNTALQQVEADRNKLRDALLTALANAGESDPWVWCDAGENFLESMSEGMIIRISARQLRALLAARDDELDTTRAELAEAKETLDYGEGYLGAVKEQKTYLSKQLAAAKALIDWLRGSAILNCAEDTEFDARRAALDLPPAAVEQIDSAIRDFAVAALDSPPAPQTPTTAETPQGEVAPVLTDADIENALERGAKHSAALAHYMDPVNHALPICGVVSASGPNGEPIACGFTIDHNGQHSWATLPTFSHDGEADRAPACCELCGAEAWRPAHGSDPMPDAKLCSQCWTECAQAGPASYRDWIDQRKAEGGGGK